MPILDYMKNKSKDKIILDLQEELKLEKLKNTIMEEEIQDLTKEIRNLRNRKLIYTVQVPGNFDYVIDEVFYKLEDAIKYNKSCKGLSKVISYKIN